MDDFKLLAIRPLKDCSSRFKKNLAANEYFTFYNSYEFNEIDEKTVIVKTESNSLNLYSIERKYNPKSINISAIVGKNGSGKSAIFDLLYVVSYLLIHKYQIPQNDLSPIEIDKNIRYNDLLAQDVLGDLSLELYFLDREHIIRLLIADEKIIFSIAEKSIEDGIERWEIYQNEHDDTTNQDFGRSQYVEPSELIEKGLSIFPLGNFFYSIAINYSIYGLKANEESWLDNLFHKNDGYQTPLVINPYRYNGNIDVNNEHHLVQSRILLGINNNLSQELLTGKAIQKIHFNFDVHRLLRLEGTSFALCLEHTLQLNHKIDVAVFYHFFKHLYYGITAEEFNLSEESITRFNTILTFVDEVDELGEQPGSMFSNNEYNYELFVIFLMKYTVYKVFKLVQKDVTYNRRFGKRFIENDRDKDNMIYSLFFKDNETGALLVDEIIKDKSHLTLKIRQTIYAIKNQTFNKSYTPILASNQVVKFKFEFDFFDFAKNLKFWINQNTRVNQLELIPTSFSNIEFAIKHNQTDNTTSSFNVLSSGEQQLVATLQTVYYHLVNLNSVDQSREKVLYRYVNILLDEIELYFHPEYQQRFIKELLNGISNLEIPNIKSINILFSTHSPFILSDIPSQNILKLDNGTPRYDKHEKTFGANIHDLLANDFFLEKGFMGEFAKSKIDGVIETMMHYTPKEMATDEETKKKCRDLIDIIGEPMLHLSLMELYKQAFGESSNDFIDEQIRRLENLKKKP